MIGQNKLSGKSSYIRIPNVANLKTIVEKLTSTYKDKYEFTDLRTDFYAYLSIRGHSIKVNFSESYVIKDIINERYIYFIFYDSEDELLITTSDNYDKNENICWQKNIPKGYIEQTDGDLDDDLNPVVVMKYTNEMFPTIFLSSMKFNKNSDVYIINNGQSFAIVCRTNAVHIYKKKDGKESYVIYDTSDKYHTENKLVSCIYTSDYIWEFLCVDTGNMYGFIPVDDGHMKGMATPNTNNMYDGYAGLIYVPADTYDNNKSGYYMEFASNPSEDYTRHDNINDKYLLEPALRTYTFTSPVSMQKNRPDSVDYIKNTSFDNNFIGLSKSSMDIYILYDIIPKYNQTVFCRNNTLGNHLDIGYYSGLRNTLDNGSIALPNITYILRQPFALKDMSAVMESEFMYMIDMSDKSNGDICEYIDNYGNKIKLICFMTYQSVTDLNSEKNTPKQLGIGIRLE